MPHTYTLCDSDDETTPLISKDLSKEDPIRKTANSNSPSSSSSTCGSYDLCADPQRGCCCCCCYCCCCVSGRPRGLDTTTTTSASPTIPWPSNVSGCSGYEPSASSIGDGASASSISSSEWETPARRSLHRLATHHVDEPTWPRTHAASRDVDEEVDGEDDDDDDDNYYGACLAQCFPEWLRSVLWPTTPASMSEAPPNHHHHYSSAEGGDDAQPTRHQHMRDPQPAQAAAASSPDNEPRYVIKFPSGTRVERYKDGTSKHIVVMELGPGH